MTLGCHRLEGAQKTDVCCSGDPVQQPSHGGVRILHSQVSASSAEVRSGSSSDRLLRSRRISWRHARSVAGGTEDALSISKYWAHPSNMLGPSNVALLTVRRLLNWAGVRGGRTSAFTGYSRGCSISIAVWGEGRPERTDCRGSCH